MLRVQPKGLLAIISFVFFACNPGREHSNRPPEDTPDTVSIEGIYTYSEELSTFRECGNDSTTYWVADADSLLRARAREFLFFPRDQSAVFAALKVVKLPPPQKREGLAAEYDSLLKVISVQEVTAKNFRTDCFPYDFWCLGNEPFWSVEISGGEHIIRLTDMGKESAYNYQYTEPAVEGALYRYEVPAESGRPALNILVTKEPCSDGMSDRSYDYSVTVQAGDRKLRGCAIAGEGIQKFNEKGVL